MLFGFPCVLKRKNIEGTVGNGCILDRTNNLRFIHSGPPYLQKQKVSKSNYHYYSPASLGGSWANEEGTSDTSCNTPGVTVAATIHL
jgi:hypothetical protein